MSAPCQTPALVVRGERVADAPARGRLKLRVDRRRDRESAQARLLGLEPIEHGLGHLDRLGRELARRLDGGSEDDGLVLRGRPLRVVEEALGVHLVEHVRAPAACRADVGARVVVARAGDAAGDERRLRDRQVLRALAEVVARGLLDAVSPAAEVDVVQVELEDLVLAQLLLEPSREQRLADLAR